MAKDNTTYGFNKADAEELLQVIGGTDETYIEGKIRGGGDGGSSSIMVLTPGGGIAARSGTTCSSATCTEYKLVSGTLTTNTNTIEVYNIWPVAIPESYYIMATKEKRSATWIAEFPGVIDVQWDDPDLEQTLDGSNYLNIDTAVDCV